MKNIVVIYDDLDENIGGYFKASQEHLSNKLAHLTELNIQTLGTNQCLTNSIDHYTSALNEQPFIFVAYAHGDEGAIWINQERYIHLENAYCFGGTVFYACGCLSAKELGKRLLEENCRLFLGYEAKISTLNPESEPIFQECENAFLTHWITTPAATVQQSLGFMYEKYKKMRKHLEFENDIFSAIVLESNLSAFKILYNEETALQDIFKIN